jgi:hypothetical protein
MDELNQYLRGVQDGKQQVMNLIQTKLIPYYDDEARMKAGLISCYELFPDDLNEIMNKVKEPPSIN